MYEQCAKKQYALFTKELAALYPRVKKIRVVQDKLNTPYTGSFYEHLAEEGFELSQRLAFYYTPKSPSWLNIMEIEFSSLVKQCLERRIPTEEKLRKAGLAIVKERGDKQIKIQWQFSIQKV